MAGVGEELRWLRASVDAIARSEGGSAEPLGPAVMADATVVPVVTFDNVVVRDRQGRGHGPALDRSTLRGRIEAGGRVAASPVLDVLFIGIWQRTALNSLSRLAGYGRTVLLVHPQVEPASLELVECDWRGIGVASHGGSDDVQWLVRPARPRPLPVTNLRFEQLMDLALTPFVGISVQRGSE